MEWIKIDISSIEKEKETIQENKDNLTSYFSKNHDITLEQIYIDFLLSPADLPHVEFILAELVKEGAITKSVSMNHFEYESKEKSKEIGM